VLIALLIAVGFVFFVWLIFFRLKLLRWSITWAVVSVLVGIQSAIWVHNLKDPKDANEPDDPGKIAPPERCKRVG
jgi:uncharacterized membrane protein